MLPDGTMGTSRVIKLDGIPGMKKGTWMVRGRGTSLGRELRSKGEWMLSVLRTASTGHDGTLGRPNACLWIYCQQSPTIERDCESFSSDVGP